MSNQNLPQAPSSKTMSSRLMTMKFMQRAAASTPPSTPQSQPRTPDTPPAKRQKLSFAPASTATPPSDLQLIQAALTEEEEKREKAIERLAEEAGETKWVLSTANGEEGNGVGALRVTKAGYSDIDQETWNPATVGRRSFGNFNRESELTDILHALKRQDDATDELSSSSEKDSEANEEEGGDESDDPAGTKELIRTSKEEATRRANDERHQRKQQRRAEKAELARLAEKRRSKEVKLNRLSSISGGGGGGGKPSGSSKQDMECYSCGGKGHARRDCPQKGKRRNEDWHGGPPKRSRSSLDY